MILWNTQELKISQVSYFLLIFVRPSTPLNGTFSTSVLNYTTLVQIVESGYPFFIIMSTVAWWTRVSWPITLKSLEASVKDVLWVLYCLLAVEMLALKIRQDQLCRGIELPSGQTAKISQFADDTTLILEDTTSLRNAMNIVTSFGALSSLQLNKKITKALWIGTSSKNKKEPLKFQCPKDPIKFLGTYLSHDAAANTTNNFYIKIRKMETKLNIWRSRDLTLFGRTMLAKSLGLSQLIYPASMLSVPETVIQQTQSKLFVFLWKNKTDKIKRQVLFPPLSKGGLSFPCFRTVIKALRLSWISRLLKTLMTLGPQSLITTSINMADSFFFQTVTTVSGN